MDKYSMLPSRGDGNFEERYKALDWVLIGAGISFLCAGLVCLFTLPLSHMFAHNFSAAAWTRVKDFYVYLLHHPFFLLKSYFQWAVTFGQDPFASVSIWIPTLPIFVFILGCWATVLTNPYYFAQLDEGSGRLADDFDIKKMNLKNGFSFILGRWKERYLLRTDNYMSMLVVGASGTGKTAAITVPNILENDDKCLIINDMSGLLGTTGGHRATLGPVFNVDFFALDNPEEGVFYPCWNPLSDMDLPPPSPGRQGYIGGLAFFLLGDGPTGTDPYWIKSGRAALEGFINYICDKCDQARANDYFLQHLYENAMEEEDYEVLESYYDSMEKSIAVKQALEHTKNRTLTFKNYLPIGKWDPIPEAWIGRQASFPLLLDTISKQQLDISSELRARRDAGDPVAFKTDIWATILSDIVEEATFYGYNRRALVEISQILALPKGQRSSVLSMALSGLQAFKNPAIRKRTASSDFGCTQLRGIKNPITGKWEPVTFYLACPPNSFSSSVQKMFVNMYSGILTIFAPSEGPCGPFPVLYILDDYQFFTEFHVAEAIGIGLSKQYAFLLCCQDLSQLTSSYGGEVETIIGNTGAKVFLRCNSRGTAERINALIETKTFVVFSESREEGWGSGKSYFADKGINYGTMAGLIISNSSIMNMPFGTQYALIQKHHNRLIKLESPLYFKDREMTKKTKIEPPPNLPEHIYNQRAEEDKLPPPEDMSVEPAYLQAKKIADREAEEAKRLEEEELLNALDESENLDNFEEI